MRGGDHFNHTGVMSEAIPPPFGVTPCMISKSAKQTVLDSPSKVGLGAHSVCLTLSCIIRLSILG